MKILRKVAISIFKELGYKTAKRWDDEMLTRKLNRLPSIIEGTPDLPLQIKNDANHMCNMVCRAITYEQDKIELYEEGDAKMAKKKAKPKTKKHFNSIAEYEGKEPSKKSKNKSKGNSKVKDKTTKKLKEKTKKNKSKSKDKKTVTVKKEAAGTNKFGYRIGTMSDTVDSALSNKKHKTAKTIAEKTGLTTAFVRMHLNHAVDNDRGVKWVDGKGYIATV